MPKYEIDVPGKGTYEVDSPTELTDAQAYAAIQSQLNQKPEKESAFRQVADVPVGVAKGFTEGVRMLADAFGADNDVSKSIRGVENYLGDLMSAQAKGNEQKIAQIMKDAEDKGVGDQVVAAFKAFSTAPVDYVAKIFGNAGPAILAALAISNPIGATAAAITVGGVMGSGSVKGSIYDAVKEELSKTMPADQAEARAVLAQEYGGKNLDQILAGTAIGGLASTTGIIPRLIPSTAKGIMAKASTKGATSRVLSATAGEAIPEAGQEGQERLAQNIALQREGVDAPTFRGVAGAATLGGIGGGVAGAGVGAFGRNQAPEQPVVEPPVQLAPEPFTPTVQADEQSSTDDLRQQSYERQIALQAESVAKAEQAGNPYVGAVDRFGAPAPVPKDRLGQPIITPPADPFAGYNTQDLRNTVSKEDRLNDPNRPAPPAPAARVPMTEELRIAQQRAVQQQNDEFAAQQELALRQAQNPSLNPEGFGAGRTSVPITPAQAQLRQSGETVTPEQAQRIDRQAKLLGQMDGLPQVEQTGLNAQADIAAGTGKPGGTGQKVPPQTRFVALEAMTPLEARQRLAVLKEDLKTEEMPAELAQFRKQGLQGPVPKNLREPNRSLHIVPHPTVGGRYAIEERVKPIKEAPEPRRAAKTMTDTQARKVLQDVQRTGIITPDVIVAERQLQGKPTFKLRSQDGVLLSDSTPADVDASLMQFAERTTPQSLLVQQRQGMADEAALNAELRSGVETQQVANGERTKQTTKAVTGGVATREEAQRIREQGMGSPYDQVQTPSTSETFLGERERRIQNEIDEERRQHLKEMYGPQYFEQFSVPEKPPTPASDQFTDKFLKPEGRKSLQDVVATPEAKAMADKVKKELLPVLKRFGLEKMGLRLVDSIEGGAEGMYFKSVITLALDNKNPMGVMRHEVIHALKELGAFTNGEWKVLTDMAKKQWINQFYSPKLQAEYKAQYDKDGDTTQTFNEYMAEEAIAQAFRFYTETKPPSGMIANLMRRLNNVFAAIREFFMGNGVTDAEQLFLAKSIFSNIESGRMTAGRAGVQPRTAPAYALKNDLTTKEGIIEDGIKRYAEALKRHRIGQTDTRGIIPQIKINALDKIHDGIRARLEATGLSKREADDLVWKKVLPEARGSVYYPDSKKYSLSEEKTYKLDIDREVRKTARSAVFTEAENKAVEDDAARLNLSPAQTAEILRAIKKQKKQFPATQGWDNLTVIGIDQKLDDLGNPIAGTEFPKYEPITYGYGTPPDKTKAPSKIDQVWMDKVADAFTKQIQAIYRRANKGDKNALSIIAHKSWYKGVAKSLRQDYGAFGDILADLLGATSPNTPVDTNWKFSMDVLKRFARGDFDTDMQAFVTYLNNGGKPSEYPAAQKIKQITGKLYGMNSTNAMLGLSDMWRAIKPGQAPKARNFALNLIGQSDMATIDVWAARMLRRVANIVSKDSYKRIPPPAEKGVTGQWNKPNATRVTGEFGFGAAVMDKVSKDLKAKGIDIAPPDLQAIAWFAEKELWGNKGWTSKVGEGGSFEENIQNSPVERYVAGYSVQQGKTPPSDNVVNFTKKVVINALGRDKNVVTFRSKETKGLYGGTVEESFDTEWVAEKGKFDPTQIVSILASACKAEQQFDFFVSQILGPNEESLNARPGVEIYFKNQKSLQDALPLLQKFTSKGQDGFTLAVDPRAKDGSDKYIGVRLQYVPEISMRWDRDLRKKFLKPNEIARVMEGKENILLQILSDVANQEGVAYADLLRYDTLVIGQENYNEYIIGNTPSKDRKPPAVWFGGSVAQHIEAAAKRYSDAEKAERGSLGGASDQQESGGKFSLRPEQLALRPSDSGGSGISFNDRKEDAVSYAGSHYGKTKTNILSGGYYGTGLKGAEAKRLAQAKDSRIGKRIYFYIPRANGAMPMRESGVGNHVYTQKFDNILGPGETMSKLYKKAQGDSNAFESFVIDNGYDGYAVPDYGMMVVLNNDIEAKYEGTVGEVHYAKTEPEKGARFSRALGALEPATFLVPDTKVNNTGNLGMMPETRDIKSKPIRLAVGLEDAATSKGYGANHILKRIEKDSTRKPPEVSKELLEDLIRNVEKTAQSFTRLYRDRNNLIAYNPITTESLILAERPDHYSVITSYRQNNMGKYGNIAWTGKAPQPATSESGKGYQAFVESQKGIPVKAGDSGVIRQPVATTFKQRKVMSPAAIQEMADDVARVKLQGKASLRAPTTPQFKKFFEGSQVVNKDGTPKPMYHATNAPEEGELFSVFKESDDGKLGAGIYFTSMPEYSENYAPTGAIMPVYLSIKNPLFIDLGDDALTPYKNTIYLSPSANTLINKQLDKKIKELTNGKKSSYDLIGIQTQQLLQKAGYDGVIARDSKGNFIETIAFKPNQIKSATGNTGAFSPESKDIRYSLTNNVPPAVHTKLVPNQSAGQQVTAAATNAIKAVREDGYFTKLRNGIVDDTSSLGNTLANQGMSQFANNKLRADMLKHTQSNSINIMTVGLQSGVPVLNTDGSIIIKRTESNIARSLILADKLDSNGYVKASKLKGGRGFVAEVARALRGADIKEEDAAMNAEGQKLIADADKLEASLNAAVKAGGQDVSAITSAKTKIDKLRKEGKELVGKNREKQVDDAQIQWAEAQLKNVPELKEIFGIWKDVNDALTDLSEDTGIISKEQAQKYRDKKFYVPLFKAREDLAEAFFHGSSAKSVAKNYKLEGADIDRNIWENIQKQYAMTIAVAYENQTRKTAIEQLQGFGLAKTVDNPNDPNINLRYKEDGKIVHAIAENPNDIVAFQMMNYELNSVMKFISGTTRVLRFGALVNPMFWFKQLIRDPIHASLTNNQIVTPFHSAVAFAKIINNSSASAKILAERGVIGAVDSTVDLNEYIGQLGKEKKTPQMISSALHKLMQIHEASDAATRVAIFESAKKEALKKGMNEEEAINFAVFRARESINFGVRGNSQTLNVLRHSIPFFQAAITSLDTVYRAATGYGLPPAERNKARITFAKRAAVMGLMSTMYAMMYTDDDEYKDLPDYVKDGNWLYPTTTPDGRKTFVKIPVPFEIGFLFKTLPEAGWRWYSGTSTGKEVAKSALDGLIHNIPGGGTIVPQAFKPVLEVVMNHSLFTGNPIEGMSDQGLPVVERGRNASDFAKAASKAGLDNIGLSPAKIDALIKGYFAELGGTFLSVTSDLIGTDKPTKNIESYLVAKSFTTDPKLSKAVSDFYKLEHNAKEMTNMFAKLKKEGLFDTAREYLEDEDKKKQMVAAPVFRKLGEQLGKIRTEIKRTESREGMTADEKQTRINELQKMLSQTAKRGYDIAERAGISR